MEPSGRRSGRARSRRAAPGQRPGLRHRHQPEQPNVIYHGHGGRRRLAHASTAAPLDAASSTASSRSASASRRAHRDRPERHRHVYVGTSGRVSPAAAGRPLQVDRRRRQLRSGSVPATPPATRATRASSPSQRINVIIVDPANSQTRLPGVDERACSARTDGGQNWTAGRGMRRRRALARARHLISRRRSRILYAGIVGPGRLPLERWRPELDADPERGDARRSRPRSVARRAASARSSSTSLRPPRLPNPAGVQVLYARLAGNGRRARSGRALHEHRPGRELDAAGRGGHAHQHAGRLQLPHGRRPGLARRRRQRHHLLRRGRPGPVGDSGANFTGLTGLHADTHAWAFVPQPSPTPSIVYCGNDGGIFRSTDGGATWTALNGGGLQTGLFYNIDLKPDATRERHASARCRTTGRRRPPARPARAGTAPRAATAGTSPTTA